jgi:hypothetical protein
VEVCNIGLEVMKGTKCKLIIEDMGTLCEGGRPVG